jgi:DNA-binding MarR family transcriptional regulator
MSATPTSGVRLANESWEALLRAQAALMRGFAAERMWDELSLKEYDVLYTLRKAGCALRLSDLNEAVLLSQPALSRLVDRLDARGLVSRCADPADRRGVLVTLTDAGAAAQQRTGARHARSVERRMRAALSPDELRTLQDLCERLGAAQPGVPDDTHPLPDTTEDLETAR